MGNLRESEIEKIYSITPSQSLDEEIDSTHYDMCRMPKDARRAFIARLRYGIPMEITRLTGRRDMKKQERVISKACKKKLKSSMTLDAIYNVWLTLIPDSDDYRRLGRKELRSAKAVSDELSARGKEVPYSYSQDTVVHIPDESAVVWIPLSGQSL